MERCYGTGFLLRQAGGPVTPLTDSHSLPAVAMMKVRDFVPGLARAGKSINKIKNLADAAFGDKSLAKTTIYNIFKKVKASEKSND